MICSISYFFLDQSRQECIEKDEEENSSLKEALEASLNIEDVSSEVNQVEKVI